MPETMRQKYERLAKERHAEWISCPNFANHHPDEPEGYLAWFDWAKKMSVKHRQDKCPGCGRLAIWVPYGTPQNANP